MYLSILRYALRGMIDKDEATIDRAHLTSEEAALPHLLWMGNQDSGPGTQAQYERISEPGHVSPGCLRMSGMPASIDVLILQSYIGCRPKQDETALLLKV
jgi:hypothetical protein